jgi:hypothetical protein
MQNFNSLNTLTIGRKDLAMSNRVMILATSLLYIITGTSWSQSYWTRSYSGLFNSVNAITSTYDNNFIAAGSKVVKLTPNGDTVWTKKFSTPSGENSIGGVAFAITPTPDGNFLVAGSTNGNAIADGGTLEKITSKGDIIWTKKIEGTAYGITPTTDGNFIIAGFSTIKITPNGEMLWTKTFGEMHAIKPTWDGNFIIAGTDPNRNLNILKIDSKGNTLWTKTIYTDTQGVANAIAPADKGNFIIAAYLSTGNRSVCFLKITQDGDILWTKRYGENSYYDVVSAISPTRDGNFIAVGYAMESEYILKIKPDGDTLWTKTIKQDDRYAYGIAPTNDGRFIIAGYSFGSSTSENRLWFHSIIDDRYGYKNIPFQFKIPVSNDCRNYIYSPLKVPSGMIVNSSGLISWLPKTDSVYREHAEFLISDSKGHKDTLSFNIYVNARHCLIIDDLFACKSIPFTLKIPVFGDSINYGYTPHKVPYGMLVSLGGTVSWTPKIDSVYKEHAEIIVSNDTGDKDTMSLNIFVNGLDIPTSAKISNRFSSSNQALNIIQLSLSQIKFSLPAGISIVEIYDISGHCIQQLRSAGPQVVWNTLNASGSPVNSGRYFAKITNGTASSVSGFTLVR